VEDVACLTIRRGEMRRRKDTRTKRGEFEGLFDDDSEELSAFAHRILDNDCSYRLLLGVVKVLCRRDCGVAPIAVFCLFLGVAGSKSPSSFVSMY